MKENGFPERLKTLLQQKQLTLAQVAKAIGTSAPSVHRWTRGGEIEYANLRALADFLEVNWVWLRYGEQAIQDLQQNLPGDGAMSELRRKYLGQIMENEARMNLAQELAHIVSWEWNVLTGELGASANAEPMFGRPLEEMRALLLPFETLPLDQLQALHAKPEQPYERDFSLPARDGAEPRWFAVRSQLQFDAQRRPARLVGVCIEVTQRKQMQAALERNEYLLRKIIEIIPVGLWIADQDGRITTANPEVQRIWGGAKFVGLKDYGEYKGWWDSTGESLGSEGWTLARAVRDGEASRGEIVNIEAFDGQHRTIIMSAIPLRDASHRIIGAIEVNQDITDIKQVERTLGQAAANWRTLLDQPLLGIAHFDAPRPALAANRRFCELLGRTPEDLAGEHPATLLDQETGQALSHRLATLEPGRIASFALEACARDGNAFRLYCIHDSRPGKEGRTLLIAV